MRDGCGGNPAVVTSWDTVGCSVFRTAGRVGSTQSLLTWIAASLAFNSKEMKLIRSVIDNVWWLGIRFQSATISKGNFLGGWACKKRYIAM